MAFSAKNITFSKYCAKKKKKKTPQLSNNNAYCIPFCYFYERHVEFMNTFEHHSVILYKAFLHVWRNERTTKGHEYLLV